MMARAKSAPLTINLLFYNSEESALVTEHAFHTRELMLAARRINLQETFQSLTSPAPILECLEICNMGEEAVMLPVNIFAGNTPSLHHITLQGVIFSWSGPIFRDLTHLNVTSLDDEASVLIASEDSHLGSIEPTSQYEQLFNALARMPALRKLDLAYCIPSRLHHHITRLLVILSCLELLSLTGTLAACTGIIQHITIPTSCTIILKCDTGDSQPIDGLVHFLNRHASRREMPSLHSLVISRIPAYIVSSSPIYVYLWSTCKPRGTPDGEPLITIQLTSSPTYLQSLESLCSVLPLDDLRVLEVDLSYNDWPSNTWIDMFGRCRDVEHVSLKGTNVISFCRTLIRTRDKGPGTAKTVERLFFKHLKSLEVCNVNLLDMDNGYGQPLHMLLATWLSRRQELLDGDKAFSKGEKASEVENVDNRLERLQVTQCSVMDKYVWGLRVVTQNLVWDHYEGRNARVEESEESEESEDESVHDI
ncbi:hypothetical protein EWM64_g8704 [Hericium alpestre]|uniref:F-box domain-containing protein n=1 Tax=Hericium alpestre TaxID=135208 RepID=A0A4Y9ZP60_9AGAM|nr:hypothetical protein EWM64_g8704 [Hericium alpestre]